MATLFFNNTGTKYWLRVFALYAVAEACIQILFLVVLNNFGDRQISLPEIHLLMWFFQCLLIAPIWWVAWSIRKKPVVVQVIANLAFYIFYSYLWFGPVQNLVGYLYEHLLLITRPESQRIPAILDSGDESSYINYQLLKHAFRLSWFYLAAYFYNYQREEKMRVQLAVANSDLELKMLKWHLNPSFYFKTIDHLRQVAKDKPINATVPILQLAKVMEYVIYEAKEKMISVKKEIQFLSNYTRLINQQGGSLTFETEISGRHDHLKIAPLLLAGIVDHFAGDQVYQEQIFSIRLAFSGNQMTTIITGNSIRNKPVTIPGDAVLKQLIKLYERRFEINHAPNEFKLIILLDEE